MTYAVTRTARTYTGAPVSNYGKRLSSPNHRFVGYRGPPDTYMIEAILYTKSGEISITVMAVKHHTKKKQADGRLKKRSRRTFWRCLH